MAVERIRMDQITVQGRNREDLGDIPAFAGRIKERGLLQPVVVKKTKHGYKLIAGERRFRAMRHNGESMIWANIIEADSRLDELLAERDENEDRKHLLPSEKVKIANEIEEIIGSRQGQRAPATSGQLAGSDGKETREVASELAGFSSTTEYRRVEKVVDNGSAKLVEAMDNGTISISDAAAVASEPKQVQNAAVRAVEQGTAKTASEATAKIMEEDDGCPTFTKLEDEPDPELPVEETVEDVMKRVNGLLESFCRKMQKEFMDNLPDDPWMHELDKRNSLISRFEGVLTTIRSCKCTKPCPKCTNGCTTCRNTGRMPTGNYNAVV